MTPAHDLELFNGPCSHGNRGCFRPAKNSWIGQQQKRQPKLLDWAPAETYLAKLQDWAPAETHPVTISFILLENCRGFAPAIFNGTPGNWVHP